MISADPCGEAPRRTPFRATLPRPPGTPAGAGRLYAVPPPRELPAVLQARDPAFIRRLFPVLAAMSDRYFRAEIEGAEHLPTRASVMVATHNGGMATPDLFCLMVAYWRRHGIETPGWGLMHQAAFGIPLLGSILTRAGAIPANPRNARAVLRHDAPLLVCPGGDVDSLKPFRERHQVQFAGRRGFLRLAIREQVPLVPVVSVGAHETLFVLNDGRWLARHSGFERLFRIKTMPFALTFPFGLTIAGVPSLPLPSKIRLRVLPRIELDEPASAADDPATLERCARHVRETMQRSLSDLAARRRWVLLG